MQPQERQPIYSLLGFLCVCFGASFAGAQGALRGLGGWYQVVAKPGWAPPPWLFVPLWTVLYGLMGISAWSAWRSKSEFKWAALLLFALQLLLNAISPWVFFSLHAFFASCIVAGAALIASSMAALFLARAQGSSGLLMIPTVVWLVIIGGTEFAIWRMNGPAAVQVQVGQPTP